MKRPTLMKWIGSVLVALVGLIHLLTHFLTEFSGKTDDQNEVLKRARTVIFEMPDGTNRTLDDIMTGYGLTWSILLVFISMITLFAKPSRAMFLLSGLACLICGLVMLQYLIMPPALMLIAAAASYLVGTIQYKDQV